MAAEVPTASDFQALFEQAPHPYLIVSADPGFTIVGVNEAYLAATMTRRESIVGHGLFEIFPDDPNGPHPTGVENLRASLLRAIQQKAPDTMPVQRFAIRRPAELGGGFELRSWTARNLPVLSPSGEVRWIIHHVEDATLLVELLGRDAARDRRDAERDRRDAEWAQVARERQADSVRTGLARDRAESLAAERSVLLAEAERLAKDRERLLAVAQGNAAELEAVIDSIPDAVYVGDATGIKRANRAALDLLGYDSLPELNKRIGELVWDIQTRAYPSGRLLSDEEQVFTRALRGERARMDVVSRHLKSGKDVVVRSSAAPVRVDGRVVAAVAVNVDITERVKREEELRARADMEKLLIGIVSHDLRSPLSAIIVGCEAVLRRDGLDEHQLKAIMRIQSSAQRAARMTFDLLDFTKIRLGGGIAVKPSPLNLHALVAATVQEVQAAYIDRQVLLEQRGDGQGEWDADRLAQVVTNLLRNALTYSPANTPVRVVSEGADGTVTLRVHNEGPPIPAEKLSQLFEPMQRATADGGEQRNIGLGLFIVKAVVEAHRGTVEARSTMEDGTLFTVSLPRIPPRT